MNTILLSALVNSVILGVVATGVISILLRFTPRRLLNAATRYGMWCVVLLLIVGLPVAFLPTRQVVVPAAPPLGSLPVEEFAPPALGGGVIDPPAQTNSVRTAKVIQYIDWFAQGDVVPPDVARNRSFSEQGKKLKF